MKIKCDVCDKMIRKCKLESHNLSQEHKLKHMTSLIQNQMSGGSIDSLSGDHYTVVEVDPNDPRFNSDNIEHNTADVNFDPNYRNRVYTYNDIVSFFAAKTAQEFEKNITKSLANVAE